MGIESRPRHIFLLTYYLPSTYSSPTQEHITVLLIIFVELHVFGTLANGQHILGHVRATETGAKEEILGFWFVDLKCLMTHHFNQLQGQGSIEKKEVPRIAVWTHLREYFNS